MPLYLRTDLWFGIRAGGSVGHIAGVINEMPAAGAGSPVFVSSDVVPGVAPDVEFHLVPARRRFWDFDELPALDFSSAVISAIGSILDGRIPSFVYQRYSLNNYAGLAISRRFGVPFVLEYNGSEVWVGRHWGRGLKHGAITERIEMANLRGADLVVVVSDVMRDELLERGIAGERILVNLNGVDPDRYRPEIDGSLVRQRYGLEDALVIGFIGTFGPWHGAENLALAFGRLLDTYPELQGRVRLLMIGDGAGLAATRDIIEHGGHRDSVVFTGSVPQEDGPRHLAACDLLVSPHVPNPDGSRFFGSPTKLFEYMAMGKPIVASALEQIADVLEDGRTAILVEPGDVDDLVRGLKTAIDSPSLRAEMGAAARAEAVSRHTWREHTRRIVDRLRQPHA
jgi:glycosyltransferase involved in cell wall biosynthesis